jgi:hypothetical protein
MFAAKRCGIVDAVEQSVDCCGGEEKRGQRDRRLSIVSDGMVACCTALDEARAAHAKSRARQKMPVSDYLIYQRGSCGGRDRERAQQQQKHHQVEQDRAECIHHELECGCYAM